MATLEDFTERHARHLDKMVDELAKGRPKVISRMDKRSGELPLRHQQARNLIIWRIEAEIMSPFIKYLLIINGVGFMAFTIDFFLCVRFPSVNDSEANSRIMNVFSIAGGALGSMLGLFVWTKSMGRHSINKDNIAWWFFSIVCLVIWVIITSVVTGFITVSTDGFLAGWKIGILKAIGLYLAVINVLTFIVFAVDKHEASSGNDHRRRAPEARLMFLSLLGGSIGGLAAMYLLRHKTRKWYFVWGLPAFIVLDAAVVLFLHGAGVV